MQKQQIAHNRQALSSINQAIAENYPPRFWGGRFDPSSIKNLRTILTKSTRASKRLPPGLLCSFMGAKAKKGDALYQVFNATIAAIAQSGSQKLTEYLASELTNLRSPSNIHKLLHQEAIKNQFNPQSPYLSLLSYLCQSSAINKTEAAQSRDNRLIQILLKHLLATRNLSQYSVSEETIASIFRHPEYLKLKPQNQQRLVSKLTTTHYKTEAVDPPVWSQQKAVPQRGTAVPSNNSIFETEKTPTPAVEQQKRYNLFEKFKQLSPFRKRPQEPATVNNPTFRSR